MPKLKLDVTGEETQSDITIPVDGSVSKADVAAQIQAIEPITDMSSDISALVAETKFMEEPVTILIHESTNPNDENFVFVGVNGEYPTPGIPWLKRGVEYTVKRKFVLNLATAKTVSFTQPFKDMASDQSNTMRRHAALKYPFSVISDMNPRGLTWLKQVMAGA